MSGPPRRMAAHSRNGAEAVARIDRFAAAMQAWQPLNIPCCGGDKTKAANDRAELLGGTPAAIREQVKHDLLALQSLKGTVGWKLIRR